MKGTGEKNGSTVLRDTLRTICEGDEDEGGRKRMGKSDCYSATLESRNRGALFIRHQLVAAAKTATAAA